MCECKEPGFCPAHNMVKNQALFDHCQKGQTIIVNGKVYESPGIIEKAGNLIASTLMHMVHGNPEVNDEKYKERLAICEECPLFDAANRTCKVCGCFMNVKAKWADVACPDKPARWPSLLKQKECKSCG
jgi:hypothetical protein